MSRKLLTEIQDAATDSSRPLVDLLRKCKILAHRLGSSDFAAWVDKELHGYQDALQVPDYRIIRTTSHANFVRMNWRVDHAAVSLELFPEEFRNLLSVHRATQGIGHYEELVRRSSEEDLSVPWPPRIAALLSNRVYEDMECTSAWQTVTVAQIVQVLDTVRTRILNFALELETEMPEDNETPPMNSSDTQEKISHTFNTYILGGNANVAAGSSSFSQSISTQVLAGNIESLQGVLVQSGVDTSDVQEISDIVVSEKPTTDGRYGPRAAKWIGKMVTKAAEGTWKIATDAAGTVLAKALSQYYGLPS